MGPGVVAANLDFSGEPRLQAYVDAGVIVPTTIVKEIRDINDRLAAVAESPARKASTIRLIWVILPVMPM